MKRYVIHWNNWKKAQFEAMEYGDPESVDPISHPVVECYPTLPKAERRARSILSQKLDSLGSVLVVEQERDNSVSWESWDDSRSNHLTTFDGKTDWGYEEWEEEAAE